MYRNRAKHPQNGIKIPQLELHTFFRLNEEVRAMDGKIEDVAAGDIYVLGGGVRATHAEFGSRVLSGHSLDGSDSRVDCSGGVSTGKSSVLLFCL